jgi:hypothetical protein
MLFGNSTSAPLLTSFKSVNLNSSDNTLILENSKSLDPQVLGPTERIQKSYALTVAERIA